MSSLSDLLAPAACFMGAAGLDRLSATRAVILGMPYDKGGSAIRVGARMGPEAIRAQSRHLDRFFPAFSSLDAVAALELADAGDVAVTLGDHAASMAACEAAARHLLQGRRKLVALGGDGCITLPVLRAVGGVHEDLAVIHFDAHTDAYPPPAPGVHTTATTFTYAASGGAIAAARCWHLGMRGTVSVSDVRAYGEGLGFRIIDDAEMRQVGLVETVKSVCAEIGDRPVHICWDMDFFDPSAAPGVCDPTWGGVTSAEGLAMLRALSSLNIVSADVNTVCPPHDTQNMTAHLAATVTVALLHLMAGRG